MTLDLRDRLETSFGDGPVHRSIDERLALGRRALRRRRLLATGTTAVAVAALAVTPYAVSLAHDSTQSAPTTRPSHPTVQKSAPPLSPHTTTTIAPGHTYAEDPILREDSPVTFDGDRLVPKPGAQITARVADPVYSTSAIPTSCQARAVAVTDASTDLFVLGYVCPHGRWDLFTETVGARADTLPAWLVAVKAAQDGGEGVR
jgi:hypothetical protein